MSLKVNDKGGSDFTLTPEGLYVARCYRLIDLGTQTVTNSWGTKQKKKVSISWELLDDDVKMEDGRPYSAHKSYTASLDEKANLRADLESWRNKKFTEEELDDFDLLDIVDTYCQIQIVHSEDGKFANVQSIVSYKAPKDDKGNKVFPKGVNELVVFDIDKPDLAVLESLGEGLKKKIMEAPEYQAASEAITKPTAKAVTANGGEPDPEPPDDTPITEQADYKAVFDDIPDIAQEDIEASSKAAEKAVGKE